VATKARAADVVFVIVAVAVAGAPVGCGGSLGNKTGSGGTTGAAGATGFGEPKCPSTVAKGAACGPSDIQFCYNPCGPDGIGGKTETCTSSGSYAEMSGCVFDPIKDYSCYRLPSAANAICPQGTTPQAGASCDTGACAVCNSVGGVPGGQYLDAAGAPKVGYCVCQFTGPAMGTWKCASDTAWPCPLGAGC